MNKKVFSSIFVSLLILIGVGSVFGDITILTPATTYILSGTNFTVVVSAPVNNVLETYDNLTLWYGNYTDAEVEWSQATISEAGSDNMTSCTNNVCNMTVNATATKFFWDTTGLDTTFNPGTGLSLVAILEFHENGTVTNTSAITNISFDNTAPVITLENITLTGEYGDSGAGGIYYSNSWLAFNITSTDPHATNCTIYHNMFGATTWTANSTSDTINDTSTAFTTDGSDMNAGWPEGVYIWGAKCYDSALVYDDENFEVYKSPNMREANITFYIDSTTPTFTKTHLFGGKSSSAIWVEDSDKADTSEMTTKLLSGVYTTELGETVTIHCDAKDDTSGLANVEFFIKRPGESSFKKFTSTTCPDQGASTQSELTKCKLSSNDLFKVGIYKVYCRVSDYMGLADSSSEKRDAFEFLVQAEEEGEITGTYVKAFNVDFSKTTEKILAEPEGRILSVSFDGVTEHTITFDEVSAEEVTLTISSDPITITLKMDESKNIDINEDGIDDFSVTYKGYIMGNAQVEFKSLEGAKIVAEEESPTTTIPTTVTPEPTIGIGIWIILGVVAVGLVVYFVLVKRKKK